MTHTTFDVNQFMHDHGLRMTSQRNLILDTLCEGERHMTFGEVYAALGAKNASIDRSTLYRTLDVFTELGLVLRAEALQAATVYELAGLAPHHHLVCKACGDEAELPDETLLGLYRRLDEQHGFQVQIDHFVLRGLCANCR